jgi:hypothetical protein
MDFLIYFMHPLNLYYSNLNIILLDLLNLLIINDPKLVFLLNFQINLNILTMLN